MYLDKHVFQKDVASYFRISQNMVSRIVREYQDDPKKNPELIKLEEKQKKHESIVKETIQSMLDNREPILNVELVSQQVKKDHGIDVDNDKVKNFMK